MKRIKTIVFDLGGVLIDYDLDRCLEAFRKLGFPHPEQYINPYKQHGMFLMLEDGSGTPEEFYRKTDELVGHHVDPKKIDEAWISFLLNIPDYKLDMLRGLRERGFQLYMLSNTNPIMFPWMERTVFTKQGLTIDDYFDRLFLSYKMKMVKPSHQIYETMIAESGIRPEETLFLDDGKKNVQAARELGFLTYHVQPHEDYRKIFDEYEA